MKTGKLIIVGLICIALLVAAVPGLVACNQQTEAKVIKVGVTTPSSGKAAEKGAPMGHANLDAFEYINNELLKAADYKIEPVWLDNGYDAAKALTNLKLSIDEGCVMFMTASSADLARWGLVTGIS